MEPGFLHMAGAKVLLRRKVNAVCWYEAPNKNSVKYM